MANSRGAYCTGAMQRVLREGKGKLRLWCWGRRGWEWLGVIQGESSQRMGAESAGGRWGQGSWTEDGLGGPRS